MPSLGMEVCLENDAERTSQNTFGKGTFVFKAKFGWEALILWKEADPSSHTNARSVVPPGPIIISQPCHDTLDLTMEIRTEHGGPKEHELVVSPGCETSTRTEWMVLPYRWYDWKEVHLEGSPASHSPLSKALDFDLKSSYRQYHHGPPPDMIIEHLTKLLLLMPT